MHQSTMMNHAHAMTSSWKKVPRAPLSLRLVTRRLCIFINMVRVGIRAFLVVLRLPARTRALGRLFLVLYAMWSLMAN